MRKTTPSSSYSGIARSLRILELITPSRIGGAETHLATITRELSTLGDTVSVFCPEGRPLIEYLTDRNITPVSWTTWGKFDPRTLWRFAALIGERQVDIVHTHLTTATLLGSLAARFTQTPCAATVHGFTSAFCYRYVDRLITVSNAVKRHMVRQGIPARKITVLYNGIPLERYQPLAINEAKRALGFPTESYRVGIFGRLSSEKGHECLLKAWPEVTAHVLGARLMVVGAGQNEAALKEQAKRLNLRDSVEFTGFISDPRSLMSACDLVVVPSLKEGFGLAAVEAMALERPVVASDTGGLAEVVSHKETGILVPPNQPEELADAIRLLLFNQEAMTAMGRAGRLRVSKYFNAANQVRLLHDTLANIASRSCNVAVK